MRLRCRSVRDACGYRLLRAGARFRNRNLLGTGRRRLLACCSGSRCRTRRRSRLWFGRRGLFGGAVEMVGDKHPDDHGQKADTHSGKEPERGGALPCLCVPFGCPLGLGISIRIVLRVRWLARARSPFRAGTPPGGNLQAVRNLGHDLAAFAKIGHKLGGAGGVNAPLDKRRDNGAIGAAGFQEPLGELNIRT